MVARLALSAAARSCSMWCTASPIWTWATLTQSYPATCSRVPKLKTFKPKLGTIDTRTVSPPPKTADAELLTPEHKAWRLAVCRRAGWRCEWVEHGKRCEASAANGHRMNADHIVERADGGALLDPNNGQCLCTRHNTLKGLSARAARGRT